MNPQFPEHFNRADYFLYHNLEEGRENKVCLYFEDQTYTYGETARMSNRVGNALRELGLEIEDRILIVLPACPEVVWTWFGGGRVRARIAVMQRNLCDWCCSIRQTTTRSPAALAQDRQCQ